MIPQASAVSIPRRYGRAALTVSYPGGLAIFRSTIVLANNFVVGGPVSVWFYLVLFAIVGFEVFEKTDSLNSRLIFWCCRWFFFLFFPLKMASCVLRQICWKQGLYITVLQTLFSY